MTKIIGHRGACGYAPENTIKSFLTAIQLGCDRTELDVRLTADNQLVVIHDEDVEKTTSAKGLVKSFSLEQLKKLDCGDGQTIPILQEVIDVCKNKIDLQIELKEEGTALMVNDLLLKNGITNNTVVSSFDTNFLKEMRECNSEIKLLLLFRKEPTDLWEIVKNLKLSHIGPRSTIVTKDMVEQAHDQGVVVYSYHTNTEEAGEQIKMLGVDEIGTDFPKLFKS